VIFGFEYGSQSSVKLAETNQIDFEFLLLRAYELIRDNEIIAYRLSQLFPFLLLDEYQDTKDIQYQILAAILKAGNGSTTAFMVCDPNQAIYESLGGYPIEIRRFNEMASITLQHKKLNKNPR
jgi:DNA helicase-2/ATP-dependent DNA helicase PcrA